MIFAGIIKSSLIDYPGKISIVLFTPGCNYNCFYCHNRALIEDINELVHNDIIDDLLRRRVGLIDGVVITGGEPTLSSGLLPFLQKLKHLGYLTKLDTNGSNPEMLLELIQENVLDYVAIDYKTPTYRYKEICGPLSDPNKTKESIQLLLDSKIAFEVRTTVIPQLSLEDLVQMAKELPIVPKYVLNPYWKPKRYQPQDQHLVDASPYSEQQIKEFSETVKLYQPHVFLPT